MADRGSYFIVFLLFSLFISDFLAKNFLVKIKDNQVGEQDDDLTKGYDDYKTVTTINDDKIVQENFGCDDDNELVLKGKIKRKVEQINHADCKNPVSCDLEAEKKVHFGLISGDISEIPWNRTGFTSLSDCLNKCLANKKCTYFQYEEKKKDCRHIFHPKGNHYGGRVRQKGTVLGSCRPIKFDCSRYPPCLDCSRGSNCVEL